MVAYWVKEQILMLAFGLYGTKNDMDSLFRRGMWIRPIFEPINRVFQSLYKFGRNGVILFKGFNNSKKSYIQWGSTWCKRLLLV